MTSPVGPASTSVGPPPGFRGRFLHDRESLAPYAGASGPYRILPRAAAVPASTDDVVRLVRWASDSSLPLVPRGAATGMPGGNVGEGVVVDLSREFRSIGAVDPAARQIRVGPGAVAADVDRAARKHGLFLPPLPSSAERCTIGGMTANNAAGARTFKYGATRDWVRGLSVVLADGRHLELSGSTDPPVVSARSGPRSGSPPGEAAPPPPPFPDLWRQLRPRWPDLSPDWPAVRKNSSGYALDRSLPSGDPVQLLVGSEGTLGVITSVTLELAPVPASRGLLLTAAAGPEDLMELVGAAGRVGASACEFFGRRFLEIGELEEDPRVGTLARDAHALVMMEVDGTPDEVDRQIEELRSVADDLGSSSRVARSPKDRDRLWDVRHAASPVIADAAERGRVSMQFIEDSVVPPSSLVAYLDGLDEILRRAETDAVVFGHAGDANVHVNPLVNVEDPEWRARVREILESTVELVAELGGTLSGEHGDGRIRAPYLRRVWSEEAVRSFEEVKRTLDPDGVLNPGVILPVEGADPLDHLSPGHP